MFDYVNNLQLALADKARRGGLKAGAGVALLIAAGFLTAALWSWLAWNLALGPALASLIVGGGFAVIGLIVLLVSKGERHRMPTPDELRDEVAARLNLAADAALDKVKFTAEEAMDSAQARVAGLFGAAGNSTRRAAARTGARVQDAAETVQDAATVAAEKVGLTEARLDEAKDSVDQALKSRAAPAVGLAGAFAIGMAVAAALRGRRSEEDFYYDDLDDDDDEDWRG